MSYTLDLYFEPAVRRHRLLQYFGTRRHYAIAENEVLYENPATEVRFVISLQPGRNLLLQRTVVSAEFEINYCRPSYFGIEAEIELSAFMAAFQPRIHDAQMRGMEEGPYSGAGFLSGWNFGNLFGARVAVSKENSGFGITPMPAEKLRAAWAWNHRRAEEAERLDNRRFVPTITFFTVEGRPSSVVVWALGMPISLPMVDYVLVGRLVSGEKRFGLASRSEVLEVAARAGFDTTMTPLDMEYFVTPPPIAKWVASIPLIDFAAFQRGRLPAHRIVDEEIIAAARKSLEQAEPIDL
jgi:hypothetical protein